MTRIISTIAIAAIAFLASCNHRAEQTFDGKVKRETISLAPKYAGRITKILIKEGDVANQGDTLAILDIPEVEAKKQQAEGALQAATWQYNMAAKGATKEQKEQVEAAYQAAQEQYVLAEKSLARVRNLYNDSLVSPQAYDEVLTKFQLARAQYDAAQAKRQEVLGGVRHEQIQMALGQKHQAEGAVQEASVVMAERFVIAPKQMSIETIALHEGELALPGYNLIIGYDPTTTWFRFTVGESVVNQFKKGETYTVVSTFGNLTIQAKLTAVNELARYGTRTSSYPNHQPSETVYELKLVPINAAEVGDLFTNFSVELKK
ncbi:MAG: biotin/lipoyl-binding protein [Breznakibacter sp.]